MKYYAISKENGARREITHEEARRYLSSNYVERVCTFDDMLSQEANIPCLFSIIEVRKDGEA